MNTKRDNIPLFSPREPIFPKKVSGFFRRIKSTLMVLFLGLYFIAPWLRWRREDSLPEQAILIDLDGRRFFYFDIEIWPHEFYFVAGLLIMAGIGLFLFTSVLGRVWCGYACPQTVWTDLFMFIERMIEGDRNKQLRLRNGKTSKYIKYSLRSCKYTIWFLISLGTAVTFTLYFHDAHQLIEALIAFEAPLVAYITIGILTSTTLVFAGFAREQICIYACPWPRIQAAMMDEETITIGYRDWRGEPRKSKETKSQGDCIDCKACVNVCPMGIDIREGQNLACITCGLCIDACDDIMGKIGKERGLIDYLSLSDEEHEKSGAPKVSIFSKIFRLRVMVYVALWSGVGILMLYSLLSRPMVELSVSPVRNPTFVTLSNGDIRNVYEVRIKNRHGDLRYYDVSLTGDMDDILRVEKTTQSDGLFEVDGSSIGTFKLFVTAQKGSNPAISPQSTFTMWIYDYETGEKANADTIFNGNPR